MVFDHDGQYPIGWYDVNRTVASLKPTLIPNTTPLRIKALHTVSEIN